MLLTSTVEYTSTFFRALLFLVSVWHKNETKKEDSNLNIRHGTINIKQYHTVTYLCRFLNGNLSGELTVLVLQVIKKINTRIRFLYRQNIFLS